MSEDRLEEIKAWWAKHESYPPRWFDNSGFDWLISEVERERKAADTVRLSNRELLRILDVRDATIATLREALEKYGNHILDYSGTEGCRVGITELEEECRCGFREALAIAQEKK